MLFNRTTFSRAVAVSVLLLAAMAMLGQMQTGTITGTVTDPSGAVIAGAAARVVDVSTNREYRATTTTAGEFVVNNVPFGFYRINVEAKGFATSVIPRVQVDVGQTAHVNVKLAVAAEGTKVEVVGEQAVVQTETTEIANTIDRKQVLELPLPTRNPLDLINTMAGMAKVSNGGTNDSFVHGLRGNATNITQDGVNVADNYVKTSSFFALSAPTVDTVGEFTVSVAGSGAGTGFGAAQVNMVTARGSNSLHGSVFWFQRTSFLNANTYFNNANHLPTPFQLQNRIGFNVGGPVFAPKVYNGKDRTWFFLAFEGFREPLSRSRSRLVLSDAARLGNFTYTRSDTGQSNTVNLLNIGTIGKTGMVPVINTAYMNYYNGIVPSPNGDAGCNGGDGVNLRCFTWNVPGRNFQNRYTARIDHQLTRNNALEFVYNQANYNTTNDFLNSIEQYFPTSPGGGQESKRQVFTWALHSVFGANKTNSARFGLTRAPVGFVIKDSFAGTAGVQVAVPNSWSITSASGIFEPSIVSNNLPQGRNTPVRQITDNFSWLRGHHNMQFTGEWRWILAGNFFYNSIPQLVFLGNNSSNPDGISSSTLPGGASSGTVSNASRVFDLVTGLLGSTQVGMNHTSPTSGYVAGVPRNIDPSQNNYAFSFTDSWKARPNFTVQYGVRWEYQAPFDLRNKLILQPDDRIGAIFGPAGVGNFFNVLTTPVVSDVLMNLAGGGNGKPLYQAQYKNFAPMLGMIWDPGSDGKTALRAGFGMHFTQDGFTFAAPASTANNGLFTTSANSVPTGVFNPSALPTITTPADVFPVSEKSLFASGITTNSITVFKKNLAVPYVLEWNLALQRELGHRITLEARYVGNHAVKQYRSTNYNELNLLNNPWTDTAGNSVPNLLTEFNHAVANLGACQAAPTTCKGAQATAGIAASAQTANNFAYWGLPGQYQLPIFNTLFKGLSGGLGSTSGYANSSFITALTPSQGLNLGSMFDTLRRSATYATARGAFPLNFFVPNPWVNAANWVDNGSWSSYNGLELEIRRRFSNGLYFVGNYTFSKTLTDARFLTSQTENQTFRSIANPSLDKNRAAFDVTHNVSLTFLYPLPLGKGQTLLGDSHGIVNSIISGWNLQGLTRWNTGAPFNLTTGRFPTGQVGQSETPVLRNMSMNQFMQQVGTFKTTSGVYWLNPDSGLFKINGASSTPVMCTSGMSQPCFDYSAAGQMGTMPFLGFNGPTQFNQDLSLIKRTAIPQISEAFNFEIRLEAFNVLNHPNFQTPTTTSLQSTQFGQLTTVADSVRGGGVTSRIVQWAVRVNF